MIGGRITYKDLKSSSNANHYSRPRFGRLNTGLGYGAWCPAKQDKNQYLQVDLKKVMFISGVATQGSKAYDKWVRSYMFIYRGYGDAWTKYTEADIEQVIEANRDRDTIALHFFSPPLVARYVRFLPQSWNNAICMRIELYGCFMDEFPCGKAGGCSPVAVCMALDKQKMVCVCKEGYHGDGKTCQDSDECARDISPCPEHADCTNTVGLFTCSCRPGFIKSESKCEDVDECKDDVCPSSIKCINTIGSYSCDCGSGNQYDTVDKKCSDVDECSMGTFTCNPLASCVNTFGSYYCSCPAGYRGRGIKVCTDVNECRQTTNPCGDNSICRNTKGGYKCSCKTGYIRKADKCIDYDECSNKAAYECPRHSICVNTAGSYKCQCKQGFFHNGPYCIDSNECLGKRHKCDVNAWCTNTAGSYRCFCKEGYLGNGTTCKKREMTYCEPEDENCEG